MGSVDRPAVSHETRVAWAIDAIMKVRMYDGVHARPQGTEYNRGTYACMCKLSRDVCMHVQAVGRPRCVESVSAHMGLPGALPGTST